VVATAAVSMLLNPDLILNRGILVSGVHNLTQNSILAALEAETGQKFAIKHVDEKRIKADAGSVGEKGLQGGD